MAIAPFLAMTGAEFQSASSLPAKIAWLACHFSPYGPGLSNLPWQLPSGCLLVVDDATPPRRHNPQLILEQLSRCVETFQCTGVLLDFQREGCEQTQSIAEHLSAALPCPTAVSEPYAGDLDCAVFLPPLPPSMSLVELLFPWKNREVWLELGTDGEIITLTENSTDVCPLPYPNSQLSGFRDASLGCHYTVRTDEKSAEFTLWRTDEDFMKLLEEAEALGVAEAIGLYQEFKNRAK